MSCWINTSQGEDLISGPRFLPTHPWDLLQDFHWPAHIGWSSGRKRTDGTGSQKSPQGRYLPTYLAELRSRRGRPMGLEAALACNHCHTSPVCVLCCFSRVRLSATPWTVARQAPLSMGFSRQEYWSRKPCLPPGDLPDNRDRTHMSMSPALTSKFFTTGATWDACTWLTDEEIKGQDP